MPASGQRDDEINLSGLENYTIGHSSDGCGSPFWTHFRNPLLDPLLDPLDPFIFSVKKEIIIDKVIHSTCATYHCFFRTLGFFDSAFSSKKVFPFTQRISKFSFSILKGNQELFSDQLLEQFTPSQFTQYVCYIPLLLSHFCFRRFSVQLEEGFPLHATYFKVLV